MRARIVFLATASVTMTAVVVVGCRELPLEFGDTDHGSTTVSTVSPVPHPTRWPPNHGRTLASLPYGEFRLAGKLPSARPAAARSFAVDRPAQRRVLDLAAALGFGDAEVAFGQSPWTVQRGEAVLQVWPETGGLWEYQRSSSYAAGSAAPPDEAEALGLSRSILRAAGLDERAAEVDVQNSTAQVQVTPTIDGHPTWGLETTIQLDDVGVVGGSGWLGTPSSAAPISVTDAASTFKRMQGAGVPSTPPPGCPTRASRSHLRLRTPPCPNVDAVFEVVGARFVLAVDDISAGLPPRLVPAWRFELRDPTAPRYVTFPAAAR